MNFVILHVDVNNFYAACHTLFEPKLHEKSVVILSANDGNAIACSPHAKWLGIKRGTPSFDLLQWVEPFGITLFSASFPLYADMSRRIVETLAHFSPEIEYYSIDELFLKVPWESAEALGRLARQIRQRVLRWTGLCSSRIKLRTQASHFTCMREGFGRNEVVDWTISLF